MPHSERRRRGRRSPGFFKKQRKKSINRVIKNLQHTIEKGQQNKEFKRSVSAEAYATIFFTLIEGGILLAKSMNDPKYLKLATDRVNLIIDQELRT